jgi:hypothetical protein
LFEPEPVNSSLKSEPVRFYAREGVGAFIGGGVGDEGCLHAGSRAGVADGVCARTTIQGIVAGSAHELVGSTLIFPDVVTTQALNGLLEFRVDAVVEALLAEVPPNDLRLLLSERLEQLAQGLMQPRPDLDRLPLASWEPPRTHRDSDRPLGLVAIRVVKGFDHIW